MKRYVLRGAKVLQGERFECDRAARDVLIEGNRIAAVAPAGTLGNAAPVIDLPRHLLVPGMINSHYHSHENFQKGRIENLPLELWMHYVRPVVPVPLTPRQIYLRTLVSAIESLKTGATAIVDDMTLGGRVDHVAIEAALQAYEDLGIRAFLGFAMMNRPVVDNFPFVEELFPADLLAQLRALPRPDPDEILETTRRLGRERHPGSRRVSVIASVSAPQRATPEFLRAVRRMANEGGLPVITHVQETRLQVVTGHAFYGRTMVEHLHAEGFHAPDTSLNQAVWLTPREMDLLAATGATAQHNPWSNLMLGSGVAPVRDLLAAGVNVSMGTDGCCSAMTSNMLNTAGVAAALSKVRDADYGRWLTAAESLGAATRGGAKALGLGTSLGEIAPGRIADLVAYRLDAPSFVPLGDPVRQLVYAERGAAIDTVIVDGEVVVREGTLTRLDERAMLDEIAAEAEGLEAGFRAAEASVAPLRAAMEKVYARCEAQAVPAATLRARIS